MVSQQFSHVDYRLYRTSHASCELYATGCFVPVNHLITRWFGNLLPSTEPVKPWLEFGMTWCIWYNDVHSYLPVWVAFTAPRSDDTLTFPCLCGFYRLVSHPWAAGVSQKHSKGSVSSVEQIGPSSSSSRGPLPTPLPSRLTVSPLYEWKLIACSC